VRHDICWQLVPSKQDDMVQSESPILSPVGSPPFFGEAADDPFGLVHAIVDGKYQIEGVVAQGGASIVYLAIHLLWERPVAFKAFNPPGDLTAAQRSHLFDGFLREGALAAELSESSLAVRRAYDSGHAVTPCGDRVPYLVLEWLDGEPLDLRLLAQRAAGSLALTLSAAMDFVSPVAEALAVAHEKGICHLDVKPGNLFVLREGLGPPEIKLIDFGVAEVFARPGPQHDDPGQFRSFTPGYAAPEQFDPGLGPTGPWTDVFALALILVELVTGHSPLGDGTPRAMARAAAYREARPTPRAYGVEVSDPVEHVFSRALAVDPMQRFETTGSFWNALDAAVGDDVVYPLPLCRGRTATDASGHHGAKVEAPSRGGSRHRVSAVRTLAATAILAAIAFDAACVAKQLGWNTPLDAAGIVRHLVETARF
jgi:serine/threonine protein kinase